MKRLSLIYLPLFLVLLGAAHLLLPESAQAIPAFTRQHKTECFTCHTVFPELTEQGENFRKNSYVWIDKISEQTAAKKPEPKAGHNDREHLLLSSLPDYVPLSISGAFNASYDDNNAEGNKFDLSTRAIALQAAGALNDKLGFWISYNLYTDGYFDPNLSNAPDNTQPDINEAFIQARHVYQTPINVRVGRMRPTLSLWRGINRTSIISPLATTSYRVGDSMFFTDAAADGVELNSIVRDRMYVAAGAVKRRDQKNLEGFGSVQFKIGGADFNGRERPVNFDEDSIFDYLTITVGGYGYVGNNNVGPQRQLNDYYRFGFESDIRYLRWRLELASAFGKDDNAVVDPAFAQGPYLERKSEVYVAELQYLIGSEILPAFRYEYQDDGARITRRYIPMVAYAPLQNAKLVFEYKREDLPTTSNNIFNLFAVISF